MLQQFLDVCPDAAICADGRGLILYWNSGAERIFGLSPEEVIGQSLDFIVPHLMRAGRG